MPKLEINNINELPGMIEEKENIISVNTARRDSLEKQLLKLENSYKKNKVSQEEYEAKKTKLKNDMKQTATKITKAKKAIEGYKKVQSLDENNKNNKEERHDPLVQMNYIDELPGIIEIKVKEIELNNQRKNSIIDEINKLEDDYINNLVSIKDYDKKKAKLENNIKDVDSRLNTLNQSLDAYKRIQGLYEDDKVEEKESEKVTAPIETSYQQYKLRLQIEKELKSEIENLNTEDNKETIESIKKALETHNENDIAKAIEESANNNMNSMVPKLETIMETYTNQTYQEYNERKKAYADLEYNLKQIEIQNYFVEDSYKIDVDVIKKALETRNLEDILTAMERAEELSKTENLNAKALFADMDKVFFKNNNVLTSTKQEDVVVKEEPKEDLEAEPVKEEQNKQEEAKAIVETNEDTVKNNGKIGLYYGNREEPRLAKKEKENENIEKIVSTISSKQLAEYLFKIPRGNIDTLMEMDDETENLISQKEKELTRILVDPAFSNALKSKDEYARNYAVLKWLDLLTPYVNTHALFSSKYYQQSPDKIILSCLSDAGYKSSDAYTFFGMDAAGQARSEIGDRLYELEKYHYFRRKYDDLPDEFSKLNTEKTNALAVIKYLKDVDNEIDDSIDQGIYAGVIRKIASEYNITDSMINDNVEETITPQEDETTVDYDNLEEGIIKETEKILTKAPEPKDIIVEDKEDVRIPFNFDFSAAAEAKQEAPVEEPKEEAAPAQKVEEAKEVSETVVENAEDVRIPFNFDFSAAAEAKQEAPVEETKEEAAPAQKVEEAKEVSETVVENNEDVRVPFNFDFSAAAEAKQEAPVEETKEETAPAQKVEEAKEVSETVVENAEDVRVPFNFDFSAAAEAKQEAPVEETKEETAPAQEVEEAKEVSETVVENNEDVRVPFNFDFSAAAEAKQEAPVEEPKEETASAQEVEETKETSGVAVEDNEDIRVPFMFDFAATQEKPPVDQNPDVAPEAGAEEDYRVPFNFDFSAAAEAKQEAPVEETKEETAPTQEVEEAKESEVVTEPAVEEPQVKEETKPKFNFSATEDKDVMEYTIPEDSRLNSYTAVKSFKQMTRALYDKISSFSYKTKIKDAIAKLRENNKSIINSESLTTEKEVEEVTPVVEETQEEIQKATKVPKVSVDDSTLLEAARILDEKPQEETNPGTLTEQEINDLVNNGIPNTDVVLKEEQENQAKEKTTLTEEEVASLIGKPIETEEVKDNIPKPNFNFTVSTEEKPQDQPLSQEEIEKDITEKSNEVEALLRKGFEMNPEPPKTDTVVDNSAKRMEWDEFSTDVKNEYENRSDVNINIENPYAEKINYDPLVADKAQAPQPQQEPQPDTSDPRKWDKMNNDKEMEEERRHRMIDNSVFKALKEADANTAITR